MKERRTSSTAGVFSVLLVGSSLSPLNTTMISVGLTPISDALGLVASEALFLVAGFYLFGAIAQPLMGTLADTAGPRRLYIFSLLLVAVSSIPILIWPNFGILLSARIVLGIGTAAAYPAAIILIDRQARLKGQSASPRMLAGLSIASMSSAALGPAFGGMIVEYLGWAWIVAVNAPLALLVLCGALIYLPEDGTGVQHSTTRRQRPDVKGMLLFATIINLLLVYFLVPSWRLWYVALLGVALFAAFVFWCLRREEPYIDFRMALDNPRLTRVYVRLFLSYVGPYSMAYAVVPWAQAGLDLSPKVIGYTQIPYATIAGVASFIAGRSMRVSGALIITPVATMVGGVLLVFAGQWSAVWMLALLGGVFGLPHGLAAVANQSLMVTASLPERLGQSAGLYRTVVFVTAIIVSGIIGSIFGDVPSVRSIVIIGWIIIGTSIINVAVSLKDVSFNSRK